MNGRTAGTWTTSRNMTYVKILEASHMVRRRMHAPKRSREWPSHTIR